MTRLLDLPAGITIRTATLEDGELLAPRLRAADADEVRATTGRSVEYSLVTSIAHSKTTYAVVEDGLVAAIFGMSQWPEKQVDGIVGAPWLLASDIVVRHSRTFLRCSRWWIAEQRQQYPLMMNFVDERNLVARQWLAWLGFEFQASIPFGHSGLPFLPFYLPRKPHV